MINNGVKKGGLYFLIALSILGYFLYKNTNKDNTQDIKGETFSTCQQDVIVSDVSNNGKEIFYAIQEDGSLKEIKPEIVLENTNVYGSSDIKTCGDVQNRYDAGDTCSTSGSVSVNFEDGNRSGNMVSKNASVDLIVIVAPIRLLSGKLDVKDSNRSLTLNDPVYKPAGEQFSNKEILVTTPPGTLHTKVKTNVIDGSIQKEGYSAKYTVSTTEGQSSPTEGESVIDKYAPNNCEACNNPSNNNPDKSNRTATYLESIRYKYPTQEEDSPSSTPVCDRLQFVSVVPNGSRTCVDVWKLITASLKAAFSDSRWNKCTESNEDDCVSSTDIVVKISPLFSETNSYMNIRNKVGMSPTSSSQYATKYITTNCIAKIGNDTGVVKCAWDMSYLFHERELAEYDDLGGSNTPSDIQYQGYLQNEESTRTDSLESM